MVVEQRASTIEGIKGCVLCTDWRGNHDRSNCKVLLRSELLPNCPIIEKGILCGRKHHILLHGATSSKYCKIARVGRKAGPPTIDKIEEDDQQERVINSCRYNKSKSGAVSLPEE